MTKDNENPNPKLPNLEGRTSRLDGDELIRDIWIVSVGGRILRGVFFGAEVGTVVGAILFAANPKFNAHKSAALYDSLRWFCLVLLFTLPVVSGLLWRSDRDFAVIGFLTFLAVMVSGVFLTMM